MPRKKKEAEVTAPTPQELFAQSFHEVLALPATDPRAFRGKRPNAPASDFQKAILGKMGVGHDANTTKLHAHASMKAFEAVYPDKSTQIWEAHKAAVDAEKAVKSAPAATAPAAAPAATAAKFTKYTVKKDDVAKPATYHQIVQLNAAGLRKYGDTSPMPTRGQVADQMNALQTANKGMYDEVMSKSNDIVAKWKHQAPSPTQTEFAQSLGIKVTPFTPASGNIAQKGSTAFSVGKGIHDVKVSDPQKYAEAKAASDAKYAAMKAGTAPVAPTVAAPVAATPAVAAPPMSLDQKAQAAVNAKLATEAAKTGVVPTLSIPAAAQPTAQAEAPEAGG